MEDEETAIHIIAHCPALAQQRIQHFGTHYQDLPLYWPTNQIASFLRETPIGSLMDPDGILTVEAE